MCSDTNYRVYPNLGVYFFLFFAVFLFHLFILCEHTGATAYVEVRGQLCEPGLSFPCVGSEGSAQVSEYLIHWAVSLAWFSSSSSSPSSCVV